MGLAFLLCMLACRARGSERRRSYRVHQDLSGATGSDVETIEHYDNGQIPLLKNEDKATESEEDDFV